MSFTKVTTAYRTDLNDAGVDLACNAGGNGGSAGQINVNAGELVFACMGWESATTTATMDDVTGLTWTAGTLIKNAQANQWTRCFRAIATQSITNLAPNCSTVDSVPYRGLIVSVFSATGTITFDEELAEEFPNDRTSFTSVGTLTVSGASGLVLVGMKAYNSVAWTLGANFSDVYTTTGFHSQEYRTTPSAGEYAMAVTTGAATYVNMSGMSFSEGGGVTIVPKSTRLTMLGIG